jgi:hypothetical protein
MCATTVGATVAALKRHETSLAEWRVLAHRS